MDTRPTKFYVPDFSSIEKRVMARLVVEDLYLYLYDVDISNAGIITNRIEIPETSDFFLDEKPRTPMQARRQSMQALREMKGKKNRKERY
jgi:hypothetical protein